MAQDCDFSLECLDVPFLCTDIHLDETIDICTGVQVLSKLEFKELLSLATKECYYIFNGKLWKQVNEVAISLPLCPTLANAFLL